jgi:DNA-binding transcriptional ArsR family regulator
MFGFKDKRKVPEVFPDWLRYQIETKMELKQVDKLLKEIKDTRISPEVIIRPIIAEIDGKSKQILDAIDELVEANFTEDVPIVAKDVSDRIVALLTEQTEMSFTELLDTLAVPRTTLARHLNKLVQEGKIERIETDKKVLYRLRGSDSSIFGDNNG